MFFNKSLQAVSLCCLNLVSRNIFMEVVSVVHIEKMSIARLNSAIPPDPRRPVKIGEFVKYVAGKSLDGKGHEEAKRAIEDLLIDKAGFAAEWCAYLMGESVLHLAGIVSPSRECAPMGAARRDIGMIGKISDIDVMNAMAEALALTCQDDFEKYEDMAEDDFNSLIRMGHILPDIVALRMVEGYEGLDQAIKARLARIFHACIWQNIVHHVSPGRIWSRKEIEGAVELFDCMVRESFNLPEYSREKTRSENQRTNEERDVMEEAEEEFPEEFRGDVAGEA